MGRGGRCGAGGHPWGPFFCPEPSLSTLVGVQQLVPSVVSQQLPSSFSGAGVGDRSRGEVPNGLEGARPAGLAGQVMTRRKCRLGGSEHWKLRQLIPSGPLVRGQRSGVNSSRGCRLSSCLFGPDVDRGEGHFGCSSSAWGGALAQAWGCPRSDPEVTPPSLLGPPLGLPGTSCQTLRGSPLPTGLCHPLRPTAMSSLYTLFSKGER